MHIYCVALSKGGSTKTTTAAELGYQLAVSGSRVLMVDLDQQGNLSTRLGVTSETEIPGTTYEVLVADKSISQAAVVAPGVPGAHVLVGTEDLADLDGRPEVITALKEELPAVATDFDAVVIDTPPDLDLLTCSALAAANTVVAAMACEAESYGQLSRLSTVLERRIAPRLRRGAAIDWVVPTRYQRRQLLDNEVLDAVGQRFTGRVTTPVREAVAVRDAFNAGLPVGAYAPDSNVAADYRQAMNAIIARNA